MTIDMTTHRRSESDEAAVNVPGWDAFADADRSLQASPRVAEAVMRAWASRGHAPAPGGGSMAAWAVAAACLVGLLSGPSVLRTVPPVFQNPPVAVASSPEARTAPVVETVSNVPVPARGAERLSAAYRAVAGTQGAPLVTLAADPPLDGESLQIVRMRVPRQALQALGLSMGDPDVAAVVEVDIVVGEDGLPRDIRRVRPVVDANEP